MEILGTRWFAWFVRREGITDRSLSAAIARAERGLVDADLGGGLIKQRVARRGQGKSGGYRTIIVYRSKKRAVFLYGFAKSEQENVDSETLRSLKRVGEGWLSADASTIREALDDLSLQEVENDEEEKPSDRSAA